MEESKGEYTVENKKWNNQKKDRKRIAIKIGISARLKVERVWLK